MHHSAFFRRRLANRILGIVGAASLALPAACTDNGAGPAGGGSTTTSKSTTTTTTKTTVTDAGTGGMGGAGGMGGMGGTGGDVPNPPVQSCFDWPLPVIADGGADAEAGTGGSPTMGVDAGPCPTDPMVVLQDFLALQCPVGWEPYKIVSGPLPGTPGGQCCYMVYNILCGPGGRPFLTGEGARVSPEQRGAGAGGWTEPGERRGAPSEDLAPAVRAALAEAWTRDALLEHASVASFARFSLSLLAAGAPADLVEEAHRAALDEIRHAKLCFALASRYAGEDVAPGPFPLGATVEVGASLAALAASTFVEGCVGETIASIVAAEQLARATDPAARAALAAIAADEARHAELAWRTVAWAVQTGGAEVREAVAAAFREALMKGAREQDPNAELRSEAMEAHGRLDAATTAQVAASVLAEVVAPAARTLLQPRPQGSLTTENSPASTPISLAEVTG